MINIPNSLEKIAQELDKHGATSILVGGAVRDHILQKDVKDYDVEVFSLKNLEELEKILSKFGDVNLVGKSFGILKLRVGNIEYDFSFPRQERKIAKGHKGFDITVDGNLDYKEAARRRDFTINSMGYNIVTKEILDPFKGQEDLKNSILKVVDKDSFIEDPLRVYRAIQFCARFELELEKNSFNLAKQMVKDGMLNELPRERVYEEFKKMLLKSKKPSVGFELARELDMLDNFPELKALIGIKQSPKWHPEGDVWVHTMMALDAMATLLKEKEHLDEKDSLKFMFSILCHDLGKPECTQINEEGKITSRGHEEAGIKPTKTFLNRLTNDVSLIDSILPLVEYHLRPSIFYRNGAKSPAIRRLALKVNIEDLVLVARADNLGRSTKEAQEGKYEAGDWLLKRAKELQVDKKPIEPILQGRDLISLGFKPSPEFKDILQKVYDKQIDGELKTKEEALAFVKNEFMV